MAGQSYDSAPPRIGATIGKPRTKGTRQKSTTTLPTSTAQKVLGAFAAMPKRKK